MALEQLDIHVPPTHKRERERKKEKNLDPCIAAYTKINSKWLIDLNRKSATIKLLEDRKRNSCDLGLVKDLRSDTYKH